MCGRYTLFVDPADLRAAFPWLVLPDDLAPRYNIAPTQPVAVVPNDGRDELSFFQWGLVPFWAKDPAIGSRMINARAETLTEKPAFRAVYRRRRCLILADGFFEWQATAGSGGAKTPFYVRLDSGAPFAFAGLWELWRPEETPILSCTIITTEPNDLLRPIHNRMPVILPPTAYRRWLAPEEQPPAALQGLLRPYPAEEMVAYPVSTRVNDPRSQGPLLVEPLDAPPRLL